MKDICRKTLEKAYLILDGEQIGDSERTQIQSHLEDCGPCFERYGIESEVKRVIGRLRGSVECPDRVKERIGRLLDEA